MNVSLVSKKNVPDDAIISIRSGAVRRQGAANANKPFVFPQSAVDGGDCVVKVDIMQNIGSGYIVLRPNQKEGRQYEVILGDNDMACEIKIDPTGNDVTPAPAEDDAATAKTKQAAKQYLEGTGLLPFVQGVLQVVAKQQPQDPFAAMAKHFNSASDEAVAPMPGSPKAAPTSPTKATPESPKATPDPSADKEISKAEEETPLPAEAGAEGAQPASGTPRNVEAPDESEQTASPPAAEEAAPAEGQAEASKAEKAEDDVDDHKSVDDVDVQFTATIRGKNLAAEAEEEKPDEQEEKNPTEEEKPNEQEEQNPTEEEKPNEQEEKNPTEEEKQEDENPTEEAKEG